MRFYKLEIDGEAKEYREWYNKFCHDAINGNDRKLFEQYIEHDNEYKQKLYDLQNKFYEQKVEELKEGFDDLSISDDIIEVIKAVYRDYVFLNSLSSNKLVKFYEVNYANQFNKEANKGYDEELTIKKFKNHTLDEFLEKFRISGNIRRRFREYHYDCAWQASKTNIFADDGDDNHIIEYFDFYEFNILNKKDSCYAIKNGYYYRLKFMSELIKKHNLNEAQYIVLLVNLDLLYTMFIEYSVNDVYGKEDVILNSNYHIDKFINNIKMLIPDDFEKNMTAYTLRNLKDNKIIYTDISLLISRYPNITYNDILRLSLVKTNYNEFLKYLEILNKCSLETKNLILNVFQSIFANTFIFPTVEEDKLNEAEDRLEEYPNRNKYFDSTKVIEKNFLFFEAYDTFFENIFTPNELIELLKRDDCNEILLAIILFKNSLIYNIPPYSDTRRITELKELIKSEEEYYPEYDYDFFGNEYIAGYVKVDKNTYETSEYLISGNLNYGKLEIENQQNIIELIKRLAKEEEKFDLNIFFNTLVKYRIDEKIYKYIETMLEQYNKYKEENKEKILIKK